MNFHTASWKEITGTTWPAIANQPVNTGVDRTHDHELTGPLK
jgi:hypothetical protein